MLKFYFLRKNYQLIFSILLIIFIPAALLFHTYFSVKSIQKNMDVELQRKALLVENVFNSVIYDSLDNRELLQQKITRIARNSPEIIAFDIVMPKEEKFEIIAGLDKEAIGTELDDLQNVMAWYENKTFAYLTKTSALSADQNLAKQQGEFGRFWVVVSPLHNEIGEKTALVIVKLSSKIIDDLIQQSVNRSYFILTIIICIILLLVASNSRLFQYALLFQKLKEVDKMKDDFISMASHELRTPITAIKGYTSMVLESFAGKIEGETKQGLERVVQSAERLDNLVGEMLDVSRIEQGRIKISLTPQEASFIVKEVIDELKVSAEEKGLRLIYSPTAEKLPPILADKDKLKQILINLIGNAIKYTFKGEITISLALKDKKISIKIRDTGVGMSAKQREGLFQKFYRIHTKETADVSGTGLGLWITKQLVEIMKGEIFIDSIENVGSEFTVLLPIAKSS